MAATSKPSCGPRMPRACPVEVHAGCLTAECSCHQTSSQRESPRGKPVASRESHAIVVAAIVSLQRDKPVASSESSHGFLRGSYERPAKNRTQESDAHP